MYAYSPVYKKGSAQMPLGLDYLPGEKLETTPVYPRGALLSSSCGALCNTRMIYSCFQSAEILNITSN